jgi:hypothetical protein
VAARGQTRRRESIIIIIFYKQQQQQHNVGVDTAGCGSGATYTGRHEGCT